MSQKWYVNHAETITQTVSGLIISYIILRLYGMSLNESLQLQSIFFVVSYIRSYLIRSAFDKINNMNRIKGKHAKTHYK